MNILWYGEAAVKLDVKSQNEELGVLICPFDSDRTGLKLPRSITADIVCIPGQQSSPVVVQGHDGRAPLLIQHPGEYEIKGIFCHVTELAKNGNRAYFIRVEAEDIMIVHCAGLTQVPDETDLQGIDGVDILLIPVGGHDLLDAKNANTLVSELQPRIVIPINYRISGLKQTRDSVDPFIKLASAASERADKLKITKKDLPADETRLVVLEKS